MKGTRCRTGKITVKGSFWANKLLFCKMEVVLKI